MKSNNEGVVNHDSAKGWNVESSTIQNNAGAGVMLSSGSRLTGSCLRNNGQYGFNAYAPDGVKGVVLDGNEMMGNNTDDWERRQAGCGCTGGGKFWATNGAEVTGNYIHDNKGVGLWADSNNVGFRFEGNYISGNGAEGIMYETSYNAVIVNNTFVRNALVKGPTNPRFPASAIYIRSRAVTTGSRGHTTRHFEYRAMCLADNWSGVVAWENADRFAGSPANTSTGLGTLVNPSVADVVFAERSRRSRNSRSSTTAGGRHRIVLLKATLSRLTPSKIPGCRPSTGCGYNGLFSNYGTYPRWSPYHGEIVQQNITFKQNNVWRNNTYTGDWHFLVEEAAHVVTWDAWRSAPYRQDAGSRMS